MGKLLAITAVMSLLFMSLPGSGFAETDGLVGKPPIEQPLIREGDFAVELANSLGISKTSEEAEAESTLASNGISPTNGWFSDYPVTPDVLAEIQEAVASAAESGKLAMSRDAAVSAVKGVSSDLGLPIIVAGDLHSHDSDYDVEKLPPAANYDEDETIPPQYYSDAPPPTEYAAVGGLEDYYVDYGPPVVTYYPPPWDYGYLYSWVPHPFWWGGFGFGGFFVLNNFHKSVIVNKHVTNITRNGRAATALRGVARPLTNQVRDASGQLRRINPARR
ncbi:MAG: hypothetical protein AAGU11_22130, partial [Syntrophobacteraceae bacterium]